MKNSKFFKGLLLALLVLGVRYLYGSALAAPPNKTNGCQFITSGVSQTVSVVAPAGIPGVPVGSPTRSLLVLNEGAATLWVNTNGSAATNPGQSTTLNNSWPVSGGKAINPDGQFSSVAVINDATGNTTCTIVVSW